MMMFSSCLENIEPEGIADLRGAKAELLRAQTALAEANAAKVNADAAYVQAQAKIQEAIAKQEEAKVAYYEAQALLAQYEAEYQALENAAYEAEKAIELEQKMAEAQAAIAEAEALAAVYAAELERDLIYVQKEIAEYQANLEKALKDLAIAKNSLTPEQLSKVSAMENAVNEARNGVEAKTVALENAARQLAAALAEVDEIKANKLNMRMAELKLAVAQAALEGKVKAEAEAKAALELDPSVTDWEAKVEAYKAEIAKLDSEWYKKDAEIDEQMASMRDSAKTDGAIGKMAANYTGHTGYEFDENTGFFSKIYDNAKQNKTFPIGEVVVTAPVDEDGNALFGGNFQLTYSNYSYDAEKSVIEQFETRLKNLSQINAKTYETQIAIEEAKIAESKNNPYNKYNLEKYNDAVAAYKAGDVLAYFNKYVFAEDFDLTVAVKEYNDALKAMEAAVKNFNDNYDKYNPDYSEEYEAALAAKVKAYNDAAVVKAQDYQKAEDDNKYAYNRDVVWADAQAAWEDAQNAVTIAETAVTTAMGGKTAEEMATFVENYDEETATDDEKDLYASYTAALEAKKEAEEAKTAAKVEYDKAKAAWEKVDEAYQKAIEAANDKETAAQKKAEEEFAKVEAAIKAKTPTFDPTYMASLYAQVDDAKADLQNKVDAIRTVATTDLTESYNTYPAEFELQEYYTVPVDQNGDGEINEADKVDGDYEYDEVTYIVAAIPEFMLETTYDGTYVDTMKSVAVADFVDKEYFKDKIVTGLASDLTALRYGYTFSYEDMFGNDQTYWLGFNTFVFDSYSGYPLALPTTEEYAEFAKTTNTIPSHIFQAYINKLNDGGNYYNATFVEKTPHVTPAVFYEVAAEMEIAGYKADIEDLKKLPDFVKAIEAAQAEFEALVAENAAQLAADKAEVEAFYAKYLAAEEKATAELDAIKAKNDAIKSRYFAMIKVISEYCSAKMDGKTTIDDLVAALQASYESAVKEVIFAEETVRQAEQAIEDVKAGIVTAADAAQRAYDRAAEELAEAIAKLERAAADLEAVIAAIYGETEETPAE